MARKAGEVIAIDGAREVAVAASALPSAETPTLRDYFAILSKRRWVFAAFFFVVVLGAGVWVFREPRVYQATCTVEINPMAPKPTGTSIQDVSAVGGGYYWQEKAFSETQYQIIRSRMVSQRVVDKLGLADDAAFLGLAKVKDPEQRQKLMQQADATGRLQGMIEVDPVKDSRVVKLSVEDTDPARAQQLANAVADAYMATNLDRKLAATRAASTWLADQLDGLNTKLEQSEVKLFDFKRQNDILTASIEDRQSIESQRLVAFNDALTKVSIRRAELEAERSALQDAKRRFAAGDRHALEAVPAVADSETVTGLRQQLLALEEEKSALSERYLDKHPKLAEVDSRIADARVGLASEIERIIQVKERQYAEVVDTQHQLQRLIAGAKREAFDLNKHEIEFDKLKRDEDNNKRLYDIVLKRHKDTDLLELLRTNNVSVLDRALLPVTPVKPNRKVVMVLAVILGALGGVALSLFFEYLDDTMKSQDDVEKVLGVSFLGIVPTIREQGQEQLSAAERGRHHDLHAHRRPKSAVAECVRSVRTNLFFMTPDHPLKRLLVTSSGPQEGKTTVATNLAIAMAQSGSKTLLVDTDMRRPRLHRAFGLANDAGVSNLIMGQARIEDVVKETPVPNLFVLPCGPVPPNPAELLHTQRFQQLLTELEGRFERIILDSPPVAAVADALILSGVVDGLVLVVKAGHTSRELALRTRQSLDDVNARIFGVVMNDIDLEKRGYGYYYYYQRYGYYYGEKPGEA